MSHSAKKPCFSWPDQRQHKNYVELLDLMESKVEKLRERATTIDMERECIISNLSRINISMDKDRKRFTAEEKEEIEVTAQRLMNRILTVEVNVITPRTEIQKRAQTKVNKLVDDLFMLLKVSDVNSNRILESYLNACRSDSVGAVDVRFQSLLLDCTADDQKRIRKRLESIKETINDPKSSILMDID